MVEADLAAVDREDLSPWRSARTVITYCLKVLCCDHATAGGGMGISGDVQGAAVVEGAFFSGGGLCLQATCQAGEPRG